MSGPALSEKTRLALVNRLDPDGRLRDLIDEAVRRYHQRRDVDEGSPQPSHERSSDG